MFNKMDDVPSIWCSMKMYKRKIKNDLFFYLEIRKRFVKACVYNVTLYGFESQTISETEKKRRETFEMYCYGIFLRIKWIDKVTNEEMLRRVQKGRNNMEGLSKKKNENDRTPIRTLCGFRPLNIRKSRSKELGGMLQTTPATVNLLH